VKPEYFCSAQRQHKAMLKAIRDGDRAGLIDLYAHHLDISRNAYVATHRVGFHSGDIVWRLRCDARREPHVFEAAYFAVVPCARDQTSCGFAVKGSTSALRCK
jgi:hypothetical protein